MKGSKVRTFPHYTVQPPYTFSIPVKINMVLTEWRNYSDYSFEKGFPDIAEMPFHLVYVRRPNFVKFALIWKEVSGMYEIFQHYCKGRKTHEQENKQAA